MGGLIDDVIAPAAEDAFNAGKDLVTGAWDTAKGVVDDVSKFLGLPPLASEIEEALNDFVNGPLRDFARTPVGIVVTRAFATAMYYPLAPIIGPQLASVTFAIPGVLRGEPFDEAWVTEFIWRVTTTANILLGMATDKTMFGGKEAIDPSTLPNVDQLKATIETIFRAVDELKKRFPDAAKIDVLKFDYAGVARDLGMRQDYLLEAVALYTRNVDALRQFCTDAYTGDIVACP